MMRKLWNQLINPEDIFASVKFLAILTYVAGITPLRISGDRDNRRLERCPIGYLITISHIGCFAFCYILSFSKSETIVRYFFDTNVSKIGETLHLLSGLLGMTTIFVCSLLELNTLIDLIYIFNDIDEQLLALGNQVNYRKILHTSLAIFLVNALMNVGFVIGTIRILNDSNLYPPVTAYLAFFLPQFMTSFVVVMFICIIQGYELRIVLLNKTLINLIPNQPTKKRSSKTTDIKSFATNKFNNLTIISRVSKRPELIVDECRQLHNSLCDLCCLTDKYFTNQILSIVAIGFLIILFNTYYILESIVTAFSSANHAIGKGPFLAFFSCHLGMYFIAILAIVYSCSSSLNESEKTACYVHQLINDSTDPVMREKLVYFSLQLIHRKVKYTGAGLFNIDRTLLFTIVGAATTYMIILLQFSVGQKN